MGIQIGAYKVLLRARSNLIWVVKCMYVRCRLLKYAYGSSMRSQRESLYVAVIIGVNAVVYAVCKCARRLNPSQIHIKDVDFAKLQGVFCEFDVRRVQIGFAKDQRGFFFIKLLSIVRDDFVEVQVVSCRHSQRPGFFCKIAIHGLRVDFTKGPGVFRQIYIPRSSMHPQ